MRRSTEKKGGSKLKTLLKVISSDSESQFEDMVNEFTWSDKHVIHNINFTSSTSPYNEGVITTFTAFIKYNNVL
jgi:hypothetical protein